MELDLEKLSKLCKPFIAMPCYGGKLEAETAQGLLDFKAICQAARIENEICFLANEALISRGRNNLTAEFMANPAYTHLVFVDADMAFDGADIFKLIARDKDVVSAACPKKTFPIKYATSFVIKSMRETGQATGPVRDSSGELIEATTVGAAFVCIKKSVIQKMIDSYQELKYDNKSIEETDPNYETLNKYSYSLFDTIQEDKSYYGEDNAFCKRWKEIGGKIWVDSTIDIGHVGRHIFRGDPSVFKNL